MNQKMIRVIAIVLAVLMAGGVLVAAFVNVMAANDEEEIDETGYLAVFTTNENGEIAVDGDLLIAPNPNAGDDEEAEDLAVIAAPEDEVPDTGTDGVPKAPVIIGLVAVVLAVACVVIPKVAKK